jgi:hypothetical protein
VAAHLLGWEIKAHLKADCLLHAKTTASNVERCLAAGEYIEAWGHLKGWLLLVRVLSPKAMSQDVGQTNAGKDHPLCSMMLPGMVAAH